MPADVTPQTVLEQPWSPSKYPVSSWQCLTVADRAERRGPRGPLIRFAAEPTRHQPLSPCLPRCPDVVQRFARRRPVPPESLPLPLMCCVPAPSGDVGRLPNCLVGR